MRYFRSKKARLIVLAILLISLPLTAFVLSQRQDIRKHASESPSVATIPEYTNSILESSQISSEGEVGASSLVTVLDNAKKRKQAMKVLAASDPKSFLQNVIPQEVKDQLAPVVQNEVETEMTIRGEYSLIHYDNFEGKSSRYEHKLQQLDQSGKITKTYILHFADSPPDLSSGATVETTGYSLDQELVIASGDEDLEPISTPVLSALGDQKTLVIMFNFLNDASQPLSKQDVEKYMFLGEKSVNAFYKETSYGKASFSGSVVGYYKIPFDNISCDANYDQWARSAESVAFANGIDINAFPRHVFVFPNRDCTRGAAWASIGGNPSRAWMLSVSQESLYSHELGHNLGVHHANTLNCRDKQVGVFDYYYIIGCRSDEYGDPTDVMGNFYPYRRFNAPHRHEVGWLTNQNVQTVTSSGTYTISGLDSLGSIKAIRIPVPTTQAYYYFSLRNNSGFDSTFVSDLPQFMKGVGVHAFSDHGNDNFSLQSQLIDSTPEGQEYNTFTNAPLTDGSVFSDPNTGISVKQVKYTTTTSGNTNLEVSIDTTTCRRGQPGFAINPLSQSGSAGDELSYTVTITNTDSNNCLATEFQLYGGVKDGTTDKIDPWVVPPQYVNLAPGTSKSVPIKVKSAVGSRIGIYTVFTSLASDQPRHLANVEFSYIVFGTIAQVFIQPQMIDLGVGKELGISALGYDSNFKPIYKGVTYEWGMSSTNSVATVNPTTGVITSIKGLRAGFGELHVIARFNGKAVTQTIPVKIIVPSPTPTRVVTPTPSRVPTPTLTPQPKPTVYSKSYPSTAGLSTGTTVGFKNTLIRVKTPIMLRQIAIFNTGAGQKYEVRRSSVAGETTGAIVKSGVLSTVKSDSGYYFQAFSGIALPAGYYVIRYYNATPGVFYFGKTSSVTTSIDFLKISGGTNAATTLGAHYLRIGHAAP